MVRNWNLKCWFRARADGKKFTLNLNFCILLHFNSPGNVSHHQPEATGPMFTGNIKIWKLNQFNWRTFLKLFLLFGSCFEKTYKYLFTPNILNYAFYKSRYFDWSNFFMSFLKHLMKINFFREKFNNLTLYLFYFILYH